MSAQDEGAAPVANPEMDASTQVAQPDLTPAADDSIAQASAATSQEVQQEDATAGADWHAKYEVEQKRYRDLQAHKDRQLSDKGKENESLKSEMAEMKSMLAAMQPGSPQPVEDTGPRDYAKIGQDDGVDAMAAAMMEDIQKSANQTLQDELNRRDASQSRQTYERQEAGMFIEQFGMNEQLQSTINRVNEKEISNGYSLSPGALYVAAQVGGDWSVAADIIKQAVDAYRSANPQAAPQHQAQQQQAPQASIPRGGMAPVGSEQLHQGSGQGLNALGWSTVS